CSSRSAPPKARRAAPVSGSRSVVGWRARWAAISSTCRASRERRGGSCSHWSRRAETSGRKRNRGYSSSHLAGRRRRSRRSPPEGGPRTRALPSGGRDVGAEALKRLGDEGPFDLVLTDLRMPGASGMDLLRVVRDRFPTSIVIVLTAFGDAAA